MSEKKSSDYSENIPNELRVSQNPLIDANERINFMQGVFFLYTITFLPSIGLLKIWKVDPENNYFTNNYFIAIIISIITFLVLSFTLSYSKIAARKKPVNYILFAACVIFLAITNRALFDYFGKFVVISLLYLLFNAIGLLIYSYITNNEFKMQYALGCGMGLVLMPFTYYLYWYRQEIVGIMIGLVAILLISLLIVYTTQMMIYNKSFMMLPDDFIMGAMRLITIIPLIPDMFTSNQATPHEDNEATAV